MLALMSNRSRRRPRARHLAAGLCTLALTLSARAAGNVLPLPAAPAAASPAGAALFAAAAYLLGILSVFLLVAVIYLAARVYALKAALRARAETPAPRQAAEPLPLQQAPAAPERESEDALAEIEASKQAIEQLLRRLADCVTTLIADQATYDSNMESHRVAIQKALTLKGLEEIERQLLREIEEMRATGRKYRAQLDQANARIAEQNEAMARIQADARMDYLTQIPNRRAFETRLAEEFERTRRYGSPLSMIMLDIDFFKKVNDTHGHPAGDKMLQLVALQLQKNIRLSDYACRYGGEEFAVLLPETPLRPARLAAEKIRKVVEKDALWYNGKTIQVTISAGVGELTPANETAPGLVERVDAALYRAKESGRNRVELAEPATPPEIGAPQG